MLTALLPALFAPSAVAQYVVPVFQYQIFYNLDLELHPGSPTVVNGRVHSNNNIWATGASSGSPLIFSNTVDAVGIISNVPSPLDPQNIGRSGNVIYAITADNPLPNSVPLAFTFGTNTTTDPMDLLAMLQLPPPGLSPPNYAAAYSTNGLCYLRNEVDLFITNAANGTGGTNLTVYYQNPNNPPNYVLQVPPDAIISSNVTGPTIFRVTNVVYAYSFVTNVSFYDYREVKTVQAVQIDVARLDVWLSNASARGGSQYDTLNSSGPTSKGHRINSIHVINQVPLTSSLLPAVRLVNGSKLPPSGLTVVTPQPLYIEGNYNTTTNGNRFSTGPGDTTNTAPAALMSDAITILSGNWSDSFTAATPLGSRNPATTTVNAASCSGIVPSNGLNYSGGAENYFRLLENWSGVPFIWNGSMVALFPSEYATNFWQRTGNYYNAPTREWGFDPNFLNVGQLPPLTLLALGTNNSPAILTQPTNQTVIAGGTASFSITTSGTPPLSYQWQFNSTNLIDATNAALTLNNVTTNQAGEYLVKVTNLAGSVTSSNVVLSVYASAVPALNGVRLNTSSGFQFTIAGVPGFNYAVQASSNLVDWVPLITNSSPFNFADTNTDGSQLRFYRAIETQ